MNEHTPEPWPTFINCCEPSTPVPDSEPIVRLGFDDYNMARACVNACAGMADPAAEIAGLKRQRDELLAVISGIVEEVPHRHGSRGNAPGHGHDTPGIWDSDNGALAGKECGWCKAWRCAVEIYNKAKGIEE